VLGALREVRDGYLTQCIFAEAFAERPYLAASWTTIEREKPLTAKNAKKSREERKKNHWPFFATFAAFLCDLCG
jgi:hypothetical protein